ncbi:MAG: hypothetical protein PF692_11095 [Kiritimatiellae bacterium]|jgi:hypothetical protein|nr:hypothetical protein [Kiritimatiellia bacterium]
MAIKIKKLPCFADMQKRREKRPNGDIYIYERGTACNKKSKKTYTVSQRLKGKIKAGTKEEMSIRPKKY